MSKKEDILVIPTTELYKYGNFQGYKSLTSESNILTRLLRPGHYLFKDRDSVENDVSWKQIIPYCIIVYQNSIFWYKRYSGVKDSRLANRISIGIGGHIKEDDRYSIMENYRLSLLRELQEELGINESKLTKYLASSIPPIGMINDDRQLIGAVHLGLLHKIEVTSTDFKLSKDEIAECGWSTFDELKSKATEDLSGGSMESWTYLPLKSNDFRSDLRLDYNTNESKIKKVSFGDKF